MSRVSLTTSFETLRGENNCHWRKRGKNSEKCGCNSSNDQSDKSINQSLQSVFDTSKIGGDSEIKEDTANDPPWLIEFNLRKREKEKNQSILLQSRKIVPACRTAVEKYRLKPVLQKFHESNGAPFGLVNRKCINSSGPSSDMVLNAINKKCLNPNLEKMRPTNESGVLEKNYETQARTNANISQSEIFEDCTLERTNNEHHLSQICKSTMLISYVAPTNGSVDLNFDAKVREEDNNKGSSDYYVTKYITHHKLAASEKYDEGVDGKIIREQGFNKYQSEEMGGSSATNYALEEKSPEKNIPTAASNNVVTAVSGNLSYSYSFSFSFSFPSNSSSYEGNDEKSESFDNGIHNSSKGLLTSKGLLDEGSNTGINHCVGKITSTQSAAKSGNDIFISFDDDLNHNDICEISSSSFPVDSEEVIHEMVPYLSYDSEIDDLIETSSHVTQSFNSINLGDESNNRGEVPVEYFVADYRQKETNSLVVYEPNPSFDGSINTLSAYADSLLQFGSVSFSSTKSAQLTEGPNILISDTKRMNFSMQEDNSGSKYDYTEVLESALQKNHSFENMKMPENDELNRDDALNKDYHCSNKKIVMGGVREKTQNNELVPNQILQSQITDRSSKTFIGKATHFTDGSFGKKKIPVLSRSAERNESERSRIF